jgi:hypothetical protein
MFENDILYFKLLFRNTYRTKNNLEIVALFESFNDIQPTILPPPLQMKKKLLNSTDPSYLFIEHEKSPY